MELSHKKSFMKKNYLTPAIYLLAATIWSCSDNNTHGSETDSTSTTTTTTMDTSTNANTTTMNTTPLGKEDSTFVIEAAIGGMMEVEAGNLAQQNANSQRLKDFGAMMVRDHGQANNELKSLVSSRGVMIPDSLPADKRKHLESMRKMTGKSFDSHYISMMKEDHNKDISKFEKEASGGQDADIKNWASKTLPTLKVHKDSIDAISKAKM
jgi:putative membrane protein